MCRIKQECVSLILFYKKKTVGRSDWRNKEASQGLGSLFVWYMRYVIAINEHGNIQDHKANKQDGLGDWQRNQFKACYPSLVLQSILSNIKVYLWFEQLDSKQGFLPIADDVSLHYEQVC